MSTPVAYKVFAILVPEKTAVALQTISSLPRISSYQAVLGISNSHVISELQNIPHWLTLLDAGSIASTWQTEGLSQDMAEYFNVSLLKGAGVLLLKDLSEAEVDQVGQGLEKLLRDSESSYLYDARGGRGTLMMAVVFPGNGQGTQRAASGHIAAVTGATYSPGGHTVLTMSRDKTAKVWEVAAGQEVFTLRDGVAGLKGATYSPDGRSILTTGSSGSLRLWDAQSGQERRAFFHDSKSVDHATYSPDGSSLASVGREGESNVVHIWDAQTGAKRLTTAGSTVLYSPDGRTIAIAVDDASIQLWNALSGQQLTTLPGRKPLYSPDGQSIAATDDNDSVIVWNAQTGQERLHIANASMAAFGPCGRSIATVFNGTGDPQVKIWDFQTGQELLTIVGNRAVYSPDESRILVTTSGGHSDNEHTVVNNTTEVWETGSRKKLFTLVGANPVYSPDGNMIVTTLDDGRAMIWEALSGQLLTTLGQIRGLVRVYGKVPLGGLSFFADRRRDVARTWSIESAISAPAASIVSSLAPESTPVLPAAPPPPVVERFVEVQYPEVVQPEQTFTLSVGLMRQKPDDAPDDAQPIDVQVNTVRVTLYAPTFDIPPTEADLQVYADKDADPLLFSGIKVKAGISGLQPIIFNFYQDWHLLGRVGVAIEVTSDPRRISQGDKRESVTLATRPEQWEDQTTPPDVVLYVTYVQSNGRYFLHYEYTWVQAQEHWPLIDAGSKELFCRIEDWVEPYYSLLSKFAQSASTDQHELENVGYNLHQQLFTAELTDFYQQFAPTAKSLLVYSNEPWIPWEVVKPYRPGLDPQLSDFLCNRFEFSRWYIGEGSVPVHPTMNLRLLSAIIPASNLANVGNEATYLNTLKQHWPTVSVEPYSPCSHEGIEQLIAAGTVNMFHFATHGRLQPNMPTVATIALDSGDTFEVSELAGPELDGLWHSAPLIFMNACHSGRQSQGLTSPDGWAVRFIENGCSGFIGANWEIDDRLAEQFAENFYNALQAGQTVAQAVQQARSAIKDPPNSTWLAYSLYAHPNMQVQVTG